MGCLEVSAVGDARTAKGHIVSSLYLSHFKYLLYSIKKEGLVQDPMP
jgi:hypothetical protein